MATKNIISDSRPLEAGRWLEEIVERFEAAWREGPPPLVAAFLPEECRQRSRALVELVHVDLEQRLKRGESARVESYLQQLPELMADPSAVVDLIEAECRLRSQCEVGLTLEEYLQRFPCHGADLSARLAGIVPSSGSAEPATTADETRMTAPAPDSSGAAVAPAFRYRVQRFHKKGGLGEVHLAEDSELGRPVALKRIRPERADDPECRQRFLREAALTARLEHPGVVPVHGLVHDASGQPWYAMRFIEGESLKDAITGYHERDGVLRRDPGERALGLRQLLNRFVAVCNTVAYAHSQGVIHRDLKPANVMLGKYGETLVVDWGLAKAVEQRETTGAGEPSLLPGPTEAEEGGTRTGQALGTPAYMSPEQSQGRREAVGPASDIYSLGAILYNLMTGKAPFSGSNLAELLPRLQRGNFPPPRQVKAGVPPALEAVCLKAMALAPAQRYATALDLAADVDRWLADEPVTAYREPWRWRARRWLKRRRTLVAAVTAALLAVLVLGSGFWWRRVDQATKTAAAVERLVDEARQYREEAKHERTADLARAKWQAALATAQRAQGRLADEDAGADLRRQVNTLVAELEEEAKDQEMLARLEDASLQRAEPRIDLPGLGSDRAATPYKDMATAASSPAAAAFDSDRAATAYQDAFHWYGIDVLTLDDEDAAARIRDRAIGEQLAAALDHWASLVGEARGKGKERLQRIARLADPDATRNALRDALSRDDLSTLQKMAASKEMAGLPVASLILLSKGLVRGKDLPAAVALLRRAVLQHQGDFWLNHELAFALMKLQPPQTDEAIRYYTAALALRPESIGVLTNLGSTLAERGRWDAALALYQRAIQLKPTYAWVHNSLAGHLHNQGRLDEASAACRKAIALDPRLPEAHLFLGGILRRQGLLDEAIAELRTALELQPNWTVAHLNLGVALANKQRWEDANAEYRQAIKLDPAFALAHYDLASNLHSMGRLDEAIAEYRKAIQLEPEDGRWYHYFNMALKSRPGLRNEIVAGWRKEANLQPDNAGAHFGLAHLLAGQGRLDKAIPEFQTFVRLRPDNAAGYHGLGVALQGAGRLQDAIPVLRQAVQLRPGDHWLHNNLADALRAAGQRKEAITEYRRVIQLQVDFNYWTYVNLGRLMQEEGRTDEAIAEFRRIVAAEPRNVGARQALGDAFHAKGRHDEAIREYRELLRLQPKHGPAYGGLGAALTAKGRREEAIAMQRQSIALQPDNPWEHYGLAFNYLATGRRAEAITMFRKVTQLLPNYAPGYLWLGTMLRDQGQVKDAVAAFRRAIALDPRSGLAHAWLGPALLDQGLYAEGLKSLRRSLDLLPVKDDQRGYVQVHLERGERLAALDPKLPTILAGKAQAASNAERLVYADLCQIKQLYAASARLYAAALAADRNLADDLRAAHRFHAALMAALAADGQGADAARLDDHQRASWRKQAIAWLRADLALHQQHLASANPADRAAAEKALRQWQGDPRLASIRDPAALARLPGEDGQVCRQLWADVAALLSRTEQGNPPEARGTNRGAGAHGWRGEKDHLAVFVRLRG